MSAKLFYAVRDNAFHAARREGRSSDDARGLSQRVMLNVRECVDTPVVAAFAQVRRQMVHATREARRLRKERDALLVTLADVMGVSELEAWAIARLDMEADDDDDGGDDGR
jgi:hypothetical protein